MSTPKIILTTQFKIYGITNNNSYQQYIGYMDRDEAKMDPTKDITLEISDYENSRNTNLGESTLKYIGDKLKTNNVFNENFELNTKQINDIKHSFNIAQQNQSPLWQLIFSFANDFLKEMGYLSLDGKTLNDDALKKATVNSVNVMREKMKLNNTVVWVAGIHYNTDNIHIHVAIVEKESSREIIKKGKFKGQYKAKIPKEIVRQMKSSFINSIVDRTPELSRISHLMRDKINHQMKEKQVFKDMETHKELISLYEKLPTNIKSWKYNNNAMNSVRPEIDNLTNNILNRYFKEEITQLNTLLKDEQDFRTSLYGASENKYLEGKLKELNASLGNTVLNYLRIDFKIERQYHNINDFSKPKDVTDSNEIKRIDENILASAFEEVDKKNKIMELEKSFRESNTKSKQNKTNEQKAIKNNKQHTSIINKLTATEINLNQLKKAFNQNLQDYLNKQQYRKIEYENEQQKQQYSRSL